jgi:hypothetical protein
MLGHETASTANASRCLTRFKASLEPWPGAGAARRRERTDTAALLQALGGDSWNRQDFLQLGAINYLTLLTVETTYQQTLLALVQAQAARNQPPGSKPSRYFLSGNARN